ncbi:MAG: hypothetical protein P4L59_10765 [Desulfosporosinus sp.]|nr:hypothetical protein [Desulfosporosinus sp.]
MRDEERIQMYYKFGLMDWRNEQQFQKEKFSSGYNLSAVSFNKILAEIIKTLKMKIKI